MKVLFVVGWLRQLNPLTTTGLLASRFANRGHEVSFLDFLDFGLDEDGRVTGAVETPRLQRDVLEAVREGRSKRSVVPLDTFDIVFLRNNPADRYGTWVERMGNPSADFGRLLRRAGVLVINDPDNAVLASHPAYALELPAHLRPRTVVTRDLALVRRFLADLGRPAVLKPLAGYGGDGVFFVDGPDAPNLPAIVSHLARSGYLVAQERIDEAVDEGDKRVLLWFGEPFRTGPGGQPSVYLRRHDARDLRNNIATGARREPTTLDARDREVVDALRPMLLRDGLLLVGLDMAGGKVIELNVFCPGGLQSLDLVYGGDAAATLVEDLEQRLSPSAPGH